MSIAGNTTTPPASDRVSARRQRAAINGLAVAISTAALITGGGWLVLLGPALIAAWHVYGPSHAYQQGQHRNDGEPPRHATRLAGLQHR